WPCSGPGPPRRRCRTWTRPRPPTASPSTPRRPDPPSPPGWRRAARAPALSSGSGRRSRVHESIDVADASVVGDDHVEAHELVGGVVGPCVPLEAGLVVVRVDRAAQPEREPRKALLSLCDEGLDLGGPV